MFDMKSGLIIPPSKTKFYRRVSQMINYTCTGYRTQWGYSPARPATRIHALVVPYGVTMVLILQIAYLYTNFGQIEFATIGSIFSIISVNLIVCANVASAKFKSYNRLMEGLINKIHLYNFINGDKVIEQIYLQTEKNIRYTAYFLFGVLTVDWISWVFVPIYKNYIYRESIRNKTTQYHTCIYIWAPFDYQYDFKNWIYIHTLNVYGVWIGCFIIICFGTASYIFIFLLIGHIKVLKYKIDTYFLGDLTHSEVHDKLVHIIKYHSFTTELFKDIQLAFGTQVAATYLHNLVGDSLMLYLVMNGDKGNLLIFGFMIVVYMGSMILVSFILEEIHYQSNSLSDAVYAVPWESMTVVNQKTLLMLLRRVQTPFVFRAAGGCDTGLRPMLSILKSIFSYYVMLSSSV